VSLKRWAALCVLLVMVGAIVCFQSSANSKFTTLLAGYRSIETGMSQAEVDAILGPGETDWGSAHEECGIHYRTENKIEVVGVRFVEGKVVSKYYSGGPPWWRHHDGGPPWK
jgi:hypothetical protein